MSRKNTQAEVRRRDNEIAADEKEIEDLKSTPKPLLDDLERLKLMRAEGKRESFEDRMRRAPVELRKRMLSKGGAIDEGKELAEDVRIARKLEKEERKQYDAKSQRIPGRSPAGSGGMNPADVEKVPGKRQLKIAKGGFVRAADGIAKRGKTKGKML